MSDTPLRVVAAAVMTADGVIERIELDPFSLSTRIHYRIAVDHRDKVASPREREVVPMIRGVGTVAVKF